MIEHASDNMVTTGVVIGIGEQDASEPSVQIIVIEGRTGQSCLDSAVKVCEDLHPIVIGDQLRYCPTQACRTGPEPKLGATRGKLGKTAFEDIERAQVFT